MCLSLSLYIYIYIARQPVIKNYRRRNHCNSSRTCSSDSGGNDTLGSASSTCVWPFALSHT